MEPLTARGKALGLIVLFLAVAGFAFGQSNEIIDSVLEEEQLSYGNAAYLVLVAAERLPETASPGEALSELETLGWALDTRSAGDAVSFGEYSYLLMESLDLSGGLMYRFFPGPRYAARDVSAIGIAEGYAIVNMDIPGDRALRMLARALSYAEGERL
ncbi:MAG: hypothetical protein ACOCW6_11405 [Spirochaetota bacterium]